MTKSNFDFEQTPQYKILQQHFSTGISLPELRSLAHIIQQIYHLDPIDRETNRSVSLMIQYFIKYWALIEPLLPYIQILDDNMQPINGNRQLFHFY